MAHILRALAALLLVLLGTRAPAAPPRPEDAVLKVPRFVSLHADKINLRTGPGRQYPIEWVLIRRDMPVEIVATFEHWRRIREWDGTTGWVEEHMLDGKRFAIVEKGGDRPLYAEPDAASGVVARAEPGAIAHLAECRGPWCRIDAAGISGWIHRGDIWGAYPDESVP
ncbi:MAG TPA: SH3 domain-containing protein [Stellaceae bacterium]|nr:SH3 domain-containing protein [Stellaceae bacterium]